MNYFYIRSNENIKNYSIVIDNFHPKWKESVKKILEEKVDLALNDYATAIIQWSNIPLKVDFSKDYGLSNIETSRGGRLKLIIDEERYKSYDISSRLERGAIISVINHYLNWLKLGLDKIEYNKV